MRHAKTACDRFHETFTHPSDLHAESAISCARVTDGFGAHVVKRPNLALPVDVGGVVTLDGLGDPKVNQLQSALDEQEIGWLEVTVDDAGLVDACCSPKLSR